MSRENRWRDFADAARALAARIRDSEAKCGVLAVAETFERLAAEERAKVDQTHS